MRYITIGLLLLVCFFAGITYGSIETNHALTKKPDEEIQSMEMEPFVEEEMMVTSSVDINEETTVIHKLASIIESVFTSVYELLINLMYSIANLFF